MKKYKYPEPDNNQIFELDYISEKGTAYFKCGHAVTNLVFEDMIDLETGLAKWELTTKTYQMNNKLNKPRAFAASPNSMLVQFGTEERECTNLTRSAIMVQTEVLVANAGVWHHVEIADLALDSVHLPSFKNHIETNGLTLSDLGITEETPDYSLQHDDFMDLEKEFPKHSYINISKLNDYEKTQGGYSGKFTLRMTLRAIDQQYLSIEGWIMAAKERKAEMLKSSNTTLLESLEEVPYEDIVNTDTPQQTIIVDTIPVTESQPVPADSVSLSLFEKLTPEKITELQGLRIQQEGVVKNNPVIVITDKKTYAEAKKTAAILLSASTEIDGTKGMEATISKYLNTIKTTVKNALAPIAKLTRDPYDKQKKLIEDWDNRVLLMVQNRSKELNSVPFVYNSENDTYSISSLVVTQKEIEELSDIDWSKKIEQGRAIVIALESAKLEQNKEIEALKETNRLLMEKLEAFMKLTGPSPATLQTAKETIISKLTSDNSAEYIENTDPFGATPLPEEAFDLTATIGTQEAQEQQSTNSSIELPNPNNKLLNQLYLDHLSVAEEKQFQECAGYYAQALDDARIVIMEIMINPDKTIQKSVAINDLIETWKL